jgi:hypothetical protein
MKQIRNEIYDDNGLVRVEFIEVEETTQEEILAEKQAELLRIYKEIQDLQNDTKS